MSSNELAGAQGGGSGKRSAERARRIARIEQAAIELFAQDGLNSFTLRGIAARAGVPLSSVQYHFGSRENLLTRTIDQLLESYISDWTRIAQDERLSPEQRLEKVLDELLDATQNPRVRSFYIHLWPSLMDSAAIETIRSSYERYFAAITMIIDEACPTLADGEARILGGLIGSLIDGLIVADLIGGHNPPPWSVLKHQARERALAMFHATVRQQPPA